MSAVWASSTRRQVLSHFTPVTEEQLRNVISRSKLTSACVDPILAEIIMDCLDILIPVILLTVNTSLLKGTIPKHLKCAAVKRLPKKKKKRGLDPNVAKNYRPVSNLLYITKLLECVAANQLIDHLD